MEIQIQNNLIAIEELKKQHIENLSIKEETLKNKFSEYKDSLEKEIVAKNGQLLE